MPRMFLPSRCATYASQACTGAQGNVTVMSQEVSRTKFNVLDIIRILGGVIFINAFASWWFTSSATWGYDGKWINHRFLMHCLVGQPKDLSLQELGMYNGSDPRLPIYVALNGSVYDVTASPHIYGPRGPYNSLTGKDAARAFVTGCFQKADEFTYDLRGLDEVEAEREIRSWQKFFESNNKYWYVGRVRHDPIDQSPPEPCIHQKYPRYNA